MNMLEWREVLKEAYIVSNKEFTDEMAKIVMLEINQSEMDKLENFMDDACDSIMILFFKKAVTGNTFGSLDKIEKRFRSTLEENYRLKTGVFINLARTYWTYALEIQDLEFYYRNTCLYNILSRVEIIIAATFFPSPGPVKVPDEERKYHQREILRVYGKDINQEELILTNPIFNKHKGIFNKIFG